MCVAGFIYQVPCNLDGVNVFVCVCYIYKYNNEVWQIRDIYLFYMLLQAINDFQKVVRTQSTSKSKSKDHTSFDDIIFSVDMAWVPSSIEVHRIFLSNKIKHKTVIAHLFYYACYIYSDIRNNTMLLESVFTISEDTSYITGAFEIEIIHCRNSTGWVGHFWFKETSCKEGWVNLTKGDTHVFVHILVWFSLYFSFFICSVFSVSNVKG